MYIVQAVELLGVPGMAFMRPGPVGTLYLVLGFVAERLRWRFVKQNEKRMRNRYRKA